MSSSKNAIVVGASSGIGAAFARTLASQGYRVALLARRIPELEKVQRGIETGWGEGRARVYENDVCDYEAPPALLAKIEEDMGKVSLFCYAAGVMAQVGKDEYDFAKDKKVLDVNLTGAMAWLDEVATRFQARGEGIIVGISSIAGDRGRRAFPSYHAAKAGLSTFLESLRNRLFQHGVQVTTIKPGFIDTPMTRGMDGLFWLKTADEAAQMIWKAVRRGRSTAYVPARWGLVSLVIRSIPSLLFKRLDI